MKRAAGYLLIEVLVAMTIAAVSLLGLLALQARTMSMQRDSVERRTVAEMVDALAERMRANHLGFAGNNYVATMQPSGSPNSVPACAAAACTAAETAARDIALWQDELRRRLPAAGAVVARGGIERVNITIAWQEPQHTPDALVADASCSGPFGGPLADTYRCFTTQVFP